MYIWDIFNPNQKKKLKGNKLVDNSKNFNSVKDQTQGCWECYKVRKLVKSSKISGRLSSQFWVKSKNGHMVVKNSPIIVWWFCVSIFHVFPYLMVLILLNDNMLDEWAYLDTPQCFWFLTPLSPLNLRPYQKAYTAIPSRTVQGFTSQWPNQIRAHTGV